MKATTTTTLSNKTVRTVRSTVFFCILKLGRESGCKKLQAIVNQRIYRRAKTVMEGPRGTILAVDEWRKASIIRLIQQNLRGKSVFRLTMEQYDTLKKLVEVYQTLGAETVLTTTLEANACEAIERFDRDFFNPSMIEL